MYICVNVLTETITSTQYPEHFCPQDSGIKMQTIHLRVDLHTSSNFFPPGKFSSCVVGEGGQKHLNDSKKYG